MCRCPALLHHTSLTRDGGAVHGECLRYGSNETGGMKRTLRGRLRFLTGWRWIPGPWYKVHCMSYREAP